MGDYGRFFLQGAVKVEAKGHNIERFLNISSKRSLSIGTVSMAGEEEDGKRNEESAGWITFITTPGDFKKMKDVARKTGVRLRIRGRQGLPFFLYRNRKRKLLASGFLSFFLFLYVLSFFIWDISFEGNHKFTDDMLSGFLESVSVYYGMRKSAVSCEELEAGIRNYFTEITWVSAEIRGTRLIIRVKENEALLKPMESDQSPCDLTAGKEGEIVGMVVRSGIPQVKIGDVVEAGTLLVDGTIPIYDDAETLVNSHETHADAEIYAKTVHQIEEQVDLSKTVKARTGGVRRGLYVRVFGYPFYFLAPAYGDAKWEIYMEQKQAKILNDFYLPIYYGTMTAFEYENYEHIYTSQEVETICEAWMEEYMEKISEKGIQILGSDGKIEVNESGWKLVGTMTVIENIAAESPVSVESNEETKNAASSGANE